MPGNLNASSLQKLMDGDIRTTQRQALIRIILNWVVMVIGAVFCTWGFFLLVGIPLFLYGFFLHRLWMRIWRDRSYHAKYLLAVKIVIAILGICARVYFMF